MAALRAMMLVAAVIASSQARAADFGRTLGSLTVAPTGAAIYSVPIWTPPGPNGLTPTISLDYSSHAGNGVAGVGWTLSAGGAIERCRRTKHQDGDNIEVNFTGGNAGDRFCIGGNKLRLTTAGGSYGAANTTYQTEFADFARITAFGQVAAGGTGPQWFKVETKSGLIYEYGNDLGSKVTAGAGSTILRWMLNKVSDRSGNTYVVSYNGTAGQGFAVPNTISWTPVSSGATTYKYEAKFNYINNRNDKDSYLGRVTGIPITNRYRLENIQIKADGVVVRQYSLTYAASPTTQMSRLGEIKECADSTPNNCLLPITFTYQQGHAGVTAGAGGVPSGSSNNILRGRYDLNGDGKDDLLFTASGICHASFGQTTGFSSPVSTGAASCGITGRVLPNGRDALIVQGSPLTVVRWNDATSSFVSASMGFNLVHSALRAADFDGDGLDDIIAPAPKKIPVYRNTSVGTGNPTFSSTPVDTLPIFDPQVTYSTVDRYPGGIRTVDFNGDGREELQSKLARTVGGGSGTTFFTAALNFAVTSGPTTGTGVSPYTAIDLNGDACIDRRQNSTIEISSCAGTAASTLTAPGNAILVLDWDGDRKSDLLVDNGGNFGVYLSTGNGFSSLISTSIPSIGPFFAMDQDGDKLDDIIKVNGTGAINYWTHTASGLVGTFATNIPDLLINVSDGYGFGQTIKYGSTAWPNYYEKGTETAAPLQEADPKIVVAEVTIDNLIGGTFNKNYFYSGDRDNADRGMESAGFQRFDETDGRNGVKTRTYFEQAYPKTALPYLIQTVQSSGTVISWSELTNTIANIEVAAFNQRLFRYVSRAANYRNEIGAKNGQTVSSKVTNYTNVDAANGNIRNVEVIVTDSDYSSPASPTAGAIWTQTTQIQFAPDTTNWCIGIPTQRLITDSSTAFGSGSAITRRVDFDVNYAKCRVYRTTIEPLSSNYWLQTTFEFDDDPGVALPDFGNASRITIAGGGLTTRSTNLTWTAAGQFPLTATNPLGQQKSFGYNFALGLKTSETDANGLITSYEFDAFARPTKTVRPDGTASRIRRVDCSASPGYCSGLARSLVFYDELASDQSVIRTNYDIVDKAARPIQSWTRTLNASSGEQYSLVNIAYDALGRLATESAPCLSANCSTQYLISHSYDLLDRPTLNSRPVSAGSPVQHNTSFDYRGSYLEITDAQGKKRRTYTDPNGWRRQIRDDSNFGQNFTYDALGSLLEVRDTDNVALLYDVQYAYGSGSFQVAAKDADLGPRTRSYNALGELIGWTDAKTQSFSATFDELGRPLTRIEPDQRTFWVWGTAADNTASAKYIGRLRDVRNETPGGVQIYKDIYAYDAKSRVSQYTVSIPGEGNFTYDYAYNGVTGALESMWYPTTAGTRPKIGYEYQNGHLWKVTNGQPSPTTYWEAKKTNERHDVVEEALGNNLTTKRSIDPLAGWLNYIRTGVTNSGNDTSIQNLNFLYDYVGNLAQRQNGLLGLTENFYYDNLYRLDYSYVLGQGNPTVDYSYAANGNVASNTAGAGAYSYTATAGVCTYHSHSQPHAVRSIGANVYCYDANGNMTRRVNDTFTWTSSNYPSQVSSGGQTAQFSYGPERQRWKMVFSDGSGTETTHYIGPALEKVTSPSLGTIYRYTISAGGMPVALLTRTSAGADTLRYVLGDHQGSVETHTASSGAFESRQSFTAFGARRDPTNWTSALPPASGAALDAVTRQGYTYHTVLGAMGLNHMNGRVQDAVTGRFISADPFITEPENSQNYNRYSYVYNNPGSFTDPSGFSTRAPPLIPPRRCTPYPFNDGSAGPQSDNILPDTRDRDGDGNDDCTTPIAPPMIIPTGPNVFVSIAGPPSTLLNANWVPGRNDLQVRQPVQAGMTGRAVAGACFRNMYTAGVCGGAVYIGAGVVLALNTTAGRALMRPHTQEREVVYSYSQDAVLTRAKREGGAVFFHGGSRLTTITIAAGAPLSVSVAEAQSRKEQALGFYMSPDPKIAVHFAALNPQPGILQFNMTITAVEQLVAAGGTIGMMQPGGLKETGTEFFLPPTAFGTFNSLRAAGEITVVPHLAPE